MVLLKNRSLRYKVGFALFFVALVVCTCSLTIPGIWIYDTDPFQHSVSRGLSVWDLYFPTCLAGYSHNLSEPWRCDYFGDSHALAEKEIAMSVMLAGLVMQLLACVLITLQNKHHHLPTITTFMPQITAGCAVLLCLAGVIIYIRFTHYAVNVRYGPGVVLLVLFCGLAYTGLFLTGMYTY